MHIKKQQSKNIMHAPVEDYSILTVHHTNATVHSSSLSCTLIKFKSSSISLFTRGRTLDQLNIYIKQRLVWAKPSKYSGILLLQVHKQKPHYCVPQLTFIVIVYSYSCNNEQPSLHLTTSSVIQTQSYLHTHAASSHTHTKASHITEFWIFAKTWT